MSAVPKAPLIFFQLSSTCFAYTVFGNQQDSWHSWKDTQQVGEPEATMDGGHQWPPHSMWYLVAAVLLVWALVKDWKVVDRSWVSPAKALQVVSSILPDKAACTAILLLAPWGGFCWLPWRLIWIMPSMMMHKCVKCRDGRRVRTVRTYTGARDAWPWWTQHLEQWVNKGQWQWTLWNYRSPHVNKAHCATEGEIWAANGAGEHPQGAPNVTEYTMYWLYT